jgi:hypothetical protein
MEAKVSSRGGTPVDGRKKCRWTLEQLRQTDGIIPSQNGTNKFSSQAGWAGRSGFGTPRNTSMRIKQDNLQIIPEEIRLLAEGDVRPQSGSNKYDSQRGMTGFGTGRDVCREGKKTAKNPSDIAPLSEEKALLTEGIVRLQSGTNRFDSQKGMTGMGTARREITKMKDTAHPEYNCETSIDQSTNPLQTGTNKFASQKGMTGFGTARRELTKMVDTKHPEYDHERPDPTTIPSQMGSNKFASQKGMTGFGQPRWETLNPLISHQNRVGQGIVPSQMGSNQFASQAGWAGQSGFGTPRNTTILNMEGMDLTYEDIKKSETIIPSQAGWNQGDSQKGYTSFGAPRDVKGKHMKRIWELEYPEAAEAPEMNKL